MKKLFITTIASLFVFSAFAQDIGRVANATKKEKLILCQSVEQQLERDHADFAVNLNECVKRKFSSRLVTEGIIEVKGNVPLTSSNRKFSMSCSVSYDAGKEDGKNLIAEAACE